MSGSGPPRPVAFEVSTLLTRHPSGVGIYGRGLIRALALLRPDRQLWQIRRFTRAARRELLPAPDLPALPYASGARLHRRFGLVHALDTRLPGRFRGPLVATLFDVISALPMAAEKGFSSARFLRRKRRDYHQIARRADLVITLSRETRDRFLEIERPAGPVVVIPPGIEPELLAAGASGRAFEPSRPPGNAGAPGTAGPPGLPPRYLLLLGALCPRKNLEAAVGAFQRARARAPDLELLVVGEALPGWSGSQGARQIALAGEGVRLLGYLDRALLPMVYGGARALLYLSHYEGFGLPVLEAQACGAPVIAARRGGIPEAAGEAALLVDPDRPGEIDAAVARVLLDAPLREELREKGRRWAARFTWESAARAVDRAYGEAEDVHRSRAEK
jgi:glycosyltransferase involved in cell wall biosynthesis